MVFQFKIQILGIKKPPVWRRVKISAAATFDELHEVIQLIFGWTFSHLYLFSEKGYTSRFQIQDMEMADGYDDFAELGDANKIRLKDIFNEELQTYHYIYDFGDDWEHKITLEKILKEEIDHPICLAGKGACPPEDCGGVWGFEAFKEMINDPDDPEYEEHREWLGMEEGEVWDVNEFDLVGVNEILKTLSS